MQARQTREPSSHVSHTTGPRTARVGGVMGGDSTATPARHRAGTRTLKRNARKTCRKNSNDWHFGATAVSGAVTGGRCWEPERGGGGGAPLRRCRWTVLFQLTHLTGTHTHTHTHAPLCPNTRDRLTFSRASCHPLETIAPILVHTLRQTTEPCVRLLESTRRSVSE